MYLYLYVDPLGHGIGVNVFIPEVRMMSEQAVRILRNILQRCPYTLDIHPVTCLPSCSADLNTVGRNCIGPNTRWVVCCCCMCVCIVLFIVVTCLNTVQYCVQNCRCRGV